VVKLDLAKFARPVKASWLDRRTGKETPAGKATSEMKPPTPADWLLWLR